MAGGEICRLFLYKLIIKKEFRILAMQRTGHHAVQEWINEGFDDPKISVNHCDFRDGTRVPARLKDKSKQIINGLFNKCTTDMNMANYAFEQVDLDELHNGKLIKPDGYKVWPAAGKFEVADSLIILVVRDCYNWAASTLKAGRYPNIGMYKKHLRQVLGLHDYLNGYPFMAISFNEWFANEEYRKTIAQKLGMKRWDKYLTVSAGGPGSSFDHRKFQGRADEMKVLERYKVYVENSKFQKVISDTELVNLNEQYFKFKPI